MRLLSFAGLLAFTVPLAGQTPCQPDALETAAHAVAAARAKLAHMSVPENDPAIPPDIQGQLALMRDGLDAAARAAFACAAPGATPETLQTTLAKATHANADEMTTPIGISNKRDIGSYGADLSLQILPLYNTPQLFKVTFRYGIECGDDNLVLLFLNRGKSAAPAWSEQLRLQAPHEARVGDAFGDFLLVTPITGNAESPSWHYVVAHGRPGCGEVPRPSMFDLSLLTPTDDPAKPSVDWHFEHPYTAGTSTARLATTEDTIDFQLLPVAPDGKPAAATSPAVEHFRFRRTAEGAVQPLAPSASGAPSSRSQP